jgi:dinuclear metal center YbgI/SA1388 family protein
MIVLQKITAFLQQFAPAELAEEWDNVGLLLGDPDQPIERLMTCLTITPATVAEAIEGRAQLVVSHHPFPFRAVRRITAETASGRMLLDLIAARIAVYSPHTALDSAPRGINQQLAAALQLRGVAPLLAVENGLAAGRWGWLELPLSLADLAQRVRGFLAIDALQIVGNSDRPVRTVAVACGAAGELLERAIQLGCDAMVVGELRFHACLEAEAAGMGVVLPGHYASERFALEQLASVLAQHFPDVATWASREERDPIRWLGS